MIIPGGGWSLLLGAFVFGLGLGGSFLRIAAGLTMIANHQWQLLVMKFRYCHATTVAVWKKLRFIQGHNDVPHPEELKLSCPAFDYLCISAGSLHGGISTELESEDRGCNQSLAFWLWDWRSSRRGEMRKSESFFWFPGADHRRCVWNSEEDENRNVRKTRTEMYK